MNKTSKIIFVTTVAILIVFTLFISIKPMFSDKKNEAEYGKNEITFIFDYSCPWCSLWMEEVYPEVLPYLKEKQVDFNVTAISVLNDDSYTWAKMDYNIQAHYPNQYVDFLSEVLTELLNNEEVNMDQYVNEVIDQFNFDKEIVLKNPDTDLEAFTKNLIEELNLESVPTVLINGKKISDPFDIEEIEKILNESL